jgi:predicted short-subunit dehydrogenase-like oxidoreductase (DUF2520 family)
LKTLNILGCGRVGRSLGYLWRAQGVFAIQDVLTTSAESANEAAEFIGAGRPVQNLDDMRPADVWMIAVPDGQIGTVAAQLAQHPGKVKPSDIVFHCSGALASDVLLPLRAQGCQLASAHCILSFSSSVTAVTQFVGTPCALEGDKLATHNLHAVFTAIGAQPFALAAEHKVLYHAAAVFATNFLPVLQVVAADLWRSTGMPQDMIAPLSASLLRNAVQNITSQGAAKALTGPAARGDTAVVALQAQAVAGWQPDAGQAYQALSRLAAQIARDGYIIDTPHDKRTSP